MEKKLDDSQAEVKKTAAAAEQQRAIATSFKTMHKDLKSEIGRMKRATLCRDENCRNEKECGRSHAKKEENNGPCRYYFFGKCVKGKDCPYKHDPVAKKAFFDQRNKEKEEEKVKEDKKKEKVKEDKEGSEAVIDLVKDDENVNKVEVKDGEEKRKAEIEKKRKKRLAQKEKAKKKKEGAPSPMETSNTGGDGNTQVKPDSAAPPPPNPATSSVTAQASGATASYPQHIHPNSVQVQQMQAMQPQPNLFARPPPPIIPSTFQFGAQNPMSTFNFSGQMQNLQPTHQTFGRGPQAGVVGQGWQPQMPTNEELMRARQEAAIQHQTMSRRMQLDQLRAELSNVQSQIHASHNQPPGTFNLQELVFQEASLMQRLNEAGKYNPGL